MLNISFLACTKVMGPDGLYCGKWRKISNTVTNKPNNSYDTLDLV